MIVWQKHNDRVKYVEFVESVMCLPTNLTVYATPTESWSRTIYICLDGKFHSWVVDDGDNGLRVIRLGGKFHRYHSPMSRNGYRDINRWMDEIS